MKCSVLKKVQSTFTGTESECMKHGNIKYPHTLLFSLKTAVGAEPQSEIPVHKALGEVTKLRDRSQHEKEVPV